MARNNRQNDFAPKGLRVEVRNNDIGGAMRRFKKKVQDDGLLQEVKERQHYVKPSTRKRKAKAAARARWLKKQAKMNQDL